MNDDQLDAIASPHQPDYDSIGGCVCAESYPCSTLALVAEVRALRDQLKWNGQLNRALVEAHEAAVLDRARYRKAIELALREVDGLRPYESREVGDVHPVGVVDDIACELGRVLDRDGEVTG
jgi:hypothetical protein